MASYVAPAPPAPLRTSPPVHSRQLPHHQQRPHSPHDFSSGLPSPHYPSSAISSPQSLSSLRRPPPPPLYQTSQPPSPYQSSYPSASSLSSVVAQVYNVVQDLTLELDPAPPGYPKPPRHPPASPSEFTSLESIGACLESVFLALHTRVGTLHKLPIATDSSSPPNASTAARISDLQHQVSSLTLERETARKDNNHLISQLSRSQRCTETLESKVSSLVLESESFERERERLLGNIEMLEETLDEIRVERNDARKEIRVSRRQWGKILVNAGKIEGALALEAKELRRRLESVSNTIQNTLPESADPPHEDGGRCCASPCPCSAPPDNDSKQLKAVNERLRRRIEVLESALEKLRTSSCELRGLTTRLAELGKDIEDESAVPAFREKEEDEDEVPIHCAT
ncbi:hypothetical protein EDC01DRAFT_780945 [Geopyxis carbonaria]|nr:hypothetical protein EDC01DRAFT_780945 [Geopyxis carbonaria]